MIQDPLASGGGDPDGPIHFKSTPSNPFIWVLYLVVVRALALMLGVPTMFVGYTDVLVNPLPCRSC